MLYAVLFGFFNDNSAAESDDGNGCESDDASVAGRRGDGFGFLSGSGFFNGSGFAFGENFDLGDPDVVGLTVVLFVVSNFDVTAGEVAFCGVESADPVAGEAVKRFAAGSVAYFGEVFTVFGNSESDAAGSGDAPVAVRSVSSDLGEVPDFAEVENDIDVNFNVSVLRIGKSAFHTEEIGRTVGSVNAVGEFGAVGVVPAIAAESVAGNGVGFAGSDVFEVFGFGSGGGFFNGFGNAYEIPGSAFGVFGDVLMESDILCIEIETVSIIDRPNDFTVLRNFDVSHFDGAASLPEAYAHRNLVRVEVVLAEDPAGFFDFGPNAVFLNGMLCIVLPAEKGVAIIRIAVEISAAAVGFAAFEADESFYVDSVVAVEKFAGERIVNAGNAAGTVVDENEVRIGFIFCGNQNGRQRKNHCQSNNEC